MRRIADSGYSTLLVPDFPLTQPAPGPMLATAAAWTDLRVGAWVYASPLHPAWLTAREAHSLSLLTDGRFGGEGRREAAPPVSRADVGSRLRSRAEAGARGCTWHGLRRFAPGSVASHGRIRDPGAAGG
ncbi:hypothetical protein [Nocardia niwae]|uniref:Luciferase-like domain-containing protein n=1 Tax=Nocardia niwae TaxID=626084 RepID=A0ABV2X3X7_9NOCA